MGGEEIVPLLLLLSADVVTNDCQKRFSIPCVDLVNYQSFIAKNMYLTFIKDKRLVQMTTHVYDLYKLMIKRRKGE